MLLELKNKEEMRHILDYQNILAALSRSYYSKQLNQSMSRCICLLIFYFCFALPGKKIVPTFSIRRNCET